MFRLQLLRADFLFDFCFQIEMLFFHTLVTREIRSFM